MKGKLRRLFTFSVIASEYCNDGLDKIEVEGCTLPGKNCKKNLLVINRSFHESQRFFLNKDYPRSIEELKLAFYHTNEIEESYCCQCTHVFRSTLTQSLEYIHEDLQKMTTGFLKTNRYIESYQMACNVLDDFRKAI